MNKFLTVMFATALLSGAAYAETTTKEPSNVTHRPAAERGATYNHLDGAKEKHAERKADEKDAEVVNGLHVDGTVHVDGDHHEPHHGVVDHKDVTDQHKTH